MTEQEAQHYFDYVVCDMGFTVRELKDNPRLAHILVHGRGLFPDEVEDDDAFFNQVLDILDSTDEAKLKKTVIENCMNCEDFQYKGFVGSVNFSEKDGVFFGKIEGIDGLVNFEGRSLSELEEAFHEAVDDYRYECRQAARSENPLQSTDKQCNISISLGNEEWNWVKQNAELHGETIEEYLQRYLEISIATSFRESLARNF